MNRRHTDPIELTYEQYAYRADTPIKAMVDQGPVIREDVHCDCVFADCAHPGACRFFAVQIVTLAGQGAFNLCAACESQYFKSGYRYAVVQYPIVNCGHQDVRSRTEYRNPRENGDANWHWYGRSIY